MPRDQRFSLRVASATAAEIATAVTEPPRRITRGELPVVMGRLVDQIEDPVAKRALENPVNPNEPKGLGTAATRDTILPKLMKSRYVTLGTGKDPAIEVTEVGLAFIEAVRRVFPAYGDPVGRALFEAELAEIGRAPSRAEAERRARDFRQRTRVRLDELIGAISAANAVQLDPSLIPPGRGDDRPPTSAMLAFAVSLAAREGIRLPRGCKSSIGVCRTFLDTHAGARPPRAEPTGEASTPRAPSDAMLRFARSLAEQQGVPCPPEVETRFDACRRFLDAHAPQRESRASERQRSVRKSQPLAETSPKRGPAARATRKPKARRRAG